MRKLSTDSEDDELEALEVSVEIKLVGCLTKRGNVGCSHSPTQQQHLDAAPKK